MSPELEQVKFRRSERCDSTFRPPLFPKNITVTDELETPVLMMTGAAVLLRKTTSGCGYPSVASRPSGYLEK